MTLNVKDIESVELDETNGPLQQSKWLAYLFPRSSFHKSYWQSISTIQKLRKSKNEVKEVMTASHSPAVGGIPLSSAVKKSSSTPHASSSPIAFFSAFGIKIEKRLYRWRGEGGRGEFMIIIEMTHTNKCDHNMCFILCSISRSADQKADKIYRIESWQRG